MGRDAPPDPARPDGTRARPAVPALLLGLVAALPAAACDEAPRTGQAMPGSVVESPGPAPRPGPVAAWFADPTDRYAHGVLGDAIEAGTLVAQLDEFPDCVTARVVLPPEMVFEDIAPRLADLDGDGRPEILVVQSHRDLGAQLAVYRATPDGAGLALLAATPFIGRTNRWLAPIGAADLDGDGHVEIAYIDRPHLARILRVWRFEAGRLTEVAALDGLTNHRIGEDFITGGLRDCGQGPEMILADARWSRVMAVRLGDGALSARALGRFAPEAVATALACAP